MTNSIAFQTLKDDGYETIMKFRLTENGKGEFYDINSEYGKKLANILTKCGFQISNTEIIKPLENPEKFMELAPIYDSSIYQRWIKCR